MTRRPAAVEKVRAWRSDPVVMVREVFGAEPDAWQADTLRAAVEHPRVAMLACKGPGKSACLAWLILWFVATHRDAQVIACSITADNLRDNLWKELAYWHGKSQFHQACFVLRGERYESKERPKTWWVSARAFAQQADPSQQATTLAGFHARNVMVVLDEVGSYPAGVFAAADAIFAVEDAEAHLVVAGNPDTVQGPLYRIATKDKHRWHVVHITGDPEDPKRSPRISVEWAKQQIADWGRDNDWVRVNVLGQFPHADTDQLISPEMIWAAEERDVEPALYEHAPIVYGLDVARYGSDSSVLYRRQGSVLSRPWVWRGKDGTELGNLVAKILLDGKRPSAVFVDVGGPGASAFDRLVVLLAEWPGVVIPVDFGGKASEERFLDKRSEIWWRTADWFRGVTPPYGGPACIPSADPELASQLTTPKFTWGTHGKRTVFALESKKDLAKRGIASPDKADALALTFTHPVAPAGVAEIKAKLRPHAGWDYNPLDSTS